MSSRKHRRLMSLWTKAGIDDRKERLSCAARILGHPVSSFTTMEESDLDDLSEALKAWETIQEQRFCNGTLYVESEMIRRFYDDPHTLTLSANSIIPDSQSRKVFMSENNLDVTEKQYQSSLDDFDTIMGNITQGLENTSVSTLTTTHGRWEKWRVINPPSVSLGLATGIGGFPRGKIIHLWGKKHAGKSMLANQMIAEAQAQGVPCVLIDAEAAATGDFVEDLGVDVSSLKVIRPSDLETLCTLLRKLSETGALVVVDSIASSESSSELERNLAKDSPRVGGNAMLWKSTLSTIRTRLLEHGGTLVLINQVRSKLNASQYEEPDKPYGSEAIQHNVDLSIRVSKVTEKNATLKSNGYQVSRLRFDKNRFSGNTQNIDLAYKPGFPYHKSLDLVRSCGNRVDPEIDLTYGEMAHHAMVSGFVATEDGTNIEPKKNRWAIRIDPAMMCAIRMDEPEFDEVAVEPLESVDPRNPGPMDDENSMFFTIPRVGELQAVKWLRDHPTARDVIIERIIDGLDEKKSYLSGE